MTYFYARKFAYIKKKQYLCSVFINHYFMLDKTISSYQGYGHRVQLLRKDAVARNYVICDNRRVITSTSHETTAKEAFLNHVAGIVRQTSLGL